MPKMSFPMHTNSKEGVEFFDYLKNKFSFPDNVYQVDITMKTDDLIRVTCSYYPRRNDHQGLVNQLKEWYKK